jgi:hypothetical protein
VKKQSRSGTAAVFSHVFALKATLVMAGRASSAIKFISAARNLEIPAAREQKMFAGSHQIAENEAHL